MTSLLNIGLEKKPFALPSGMKYPKYHAIILIEQLVAILILICNNDKLRRITD